MLQAFSSLLTNIMKMHWPVWGQNVTVYIEWDLLLLCCRRQHHPLVRIQLLQLSTWGYTNIIYKRLLLLQPPGNISRYTCICTVPPIFMLRLHVLYNSTHVIVHPIYATCHDTFHIFLLFITSACAYVCCAYLSRLSVDRHDLCSSSRTTGTNRLHHPHWR